MNEPEQIDDSTMEFMLAKLLKNVRSIPEEEAEAMKKQEEESRRADRASYLRHNWDAPKRHVVATVDKTGPWAEKLAAIETGLGTGRMWALTGTRGNGKTQLAVEVMRTATNRGLSAKYTSAIRLFAEIKASYRRDAECTEIEVLEEYRKPRLLVIDEIGKRGETEWEANLLFELLNNRYGDMTDTILIANLALQELSASLGPSLASRLNETGGVIHCDWPGRR